MDLFLNFYKWKNSLEVEHLSLFASNGLRLIPGVSWVLYEGLGPEKSPCLGHLHPQGLLRVEGDVYIGLQLFPGLQSSGPDIFSVCPPDYTPEQVLVRLASVSVLCNISEKCDAATGAKTRFYVVE